MTKRLVAAILEAASKKPTPRLLAFDPTPAGLVGNRSLRLAYKNEWARIRARHFKENDFSCELCKKVETEARLIHAHEVYSFPDPDIVRLERILFVCTRCHDAIHLERTRHRCGLPYVRVIEEHYCKINGVTKDDLIADYGHAIQRGFAIREFYGGAGATPKIDFGSYQSGVDATLKRKRTRSPADEDDDSGFEMYPDHECPWDMGRY